MRTVRRLAAREPVARWLPGLVTVAVVLAVWWPFFRSSRVDNHAGDWLLRAHYMRYALNAMLHDGQLPLWVTSPSYEQPRITGVHELFANPETEVLSLTTLFAIFGGLLRGTKLAFAVYLVAGALGSHRLLRALKGGGAVSFLAPLLLALLALCNGSVVAKALIGHTQFLTIALFPLALAWMVESWDARLPARSRRLRAALCGALLALAYYAGNTHPLFHFVLLFPGLFSLLSLANRPGDARVIVPSTLVLAGSFLGVAAFKLLPGLYAFHGYKAGYVVSYTGWGDVIHNLFLRWSKKPGAGEFPHELNLYVGNCGAAVLVLALTLRNDRARSLPLIAVVAALLACTRDGDPLQQLPFFSTQGAFARFGLQALLAMAVAGCLRVEELLDAARTRERWIRLGCVAIVACLAVGLAFNLRANVKRVTLAYAQDDVPEGAEPIDVAPPFDVEAGRKVRIASTQVSANAMTYEYAVLDGQGPPLFIAHDLSVTGGAPRLRLEGSGSLTDRDGKLAVRATDTAGTFTLRYSNPLVTWGLLVTLATCLALAVAGTGAFMAYRRGSGERTSRCRV